jgi:hypothetical protein
MLVYIILGEFQLAASKRLCLFSLSVAVLFMGFTSDIPDEIAYMQFYNNAYLYSWEDIFYPLEAIAKGLPSDYGFSTMNYIFYSLGSSYFVYKLCLVFFTIYTIYKYSAIASYSMLIVCLYMIYPWFYDVIQVRSALMALCICNAFFSYSFSEKHRMLKYIVWIVVGTLFHKSGIVFLLFVLICKGWNNPVGRKLIMLSSGVVSLLPLYANVVKERWQDVAFMLQAQDGYAELSRYTERIVNNGYLIGYIVIMLSLLLLVFLQRSASDIKIQEYINNGKLMFISMTYIFPIFPLFMDASLRYPRAVMLILYILIALYCKNVQQKKYKWIALFCGLLIVMSFREMSLYSSVIQDAYNAVLEHNIIFHMVME